MLNVFIILSLLFGLGVQVKPAIALDPVPYPIVVNSNGDEPDFAPGGVCETATGNGVCTLRAAIQNANSLNSINGTLITFLIDRGAAVGPTFIAIGTALPIIEEIGTTIQGPNLDDNSAVVLDGGGTGAFPGLEIRANNCAIKNLTISNFGGYGIVVGASAIPLLTGTLITGNKIGDLAPFSITPKPNAGGIKLINAGSSVIGGNTIVERNIIAGNSGYGVLLDAGGTNVIKGNYIGVKSDGTQALPNSFGIFIDDSDGNTIGGSNVGERNIISGNTSIGMFVQGDDNVVTGNYIGTDVTGTLAVANGSNGIRVGNLVISYSGNQIGGFNPSEGNLISGNVDAGIAVYNSGQISIRGNTIGLDVTQTVAMPNLFGITIDDSMNNFIGGTISGMGNVISGNTRQGIFVGGSDTENTSIRGNRIGINSSGVAFANGLDGIMVQYARDTAIGSSEVFGRNIIANNGENGIELESAYASVEVNSIVNNAALGIDVWRLGSQQGVTPNDLEETDNIQNFPVITDVSFPTSDTVLLKGQVKTLADENLDLYFYGNDACDPSGHGEGQVYLGKLAISADGTGQVNFSQTLTLPSSLIFFNATVAGLTLGQSEFSACLAAFSVYLPLIMR